MAVVRVFSHELCMSFEFCSKVKLNLEKRIKTRKEGERIKFPRMKASVAKVSRSQNVQKSHLILNVDIQCDVSFQSSRVFQHKKYNPRFKSHTIRYILIKSINKRGFFFLSLSLFRCCVQCALMWFLKELFVSRSYKILIRSYTTHYWTLSVARAFICFMFFFTIQCL